jgi:hypothetical protein
MQLCPHGHVDAAACTECSMLNNVKPLVRANNATFTEMQIRRLTPSPSDATSAGDPASTKSTDIPTSTLRIKRLVPGDQDAGLMTGNSGNLHARLKQVLGRGFEIGMLDDGVERRIKEIQKRETNPRAKLE